MLADVVIGNLVVVGSGRAVAGDLPEDLVSAGESRRRQANPAHDRQNLSRTSGHLR